jgi:hypothetical protein
MLVADETRKNDLTFGAVIVRQNYKLRFPEKVQIASLPPAVKMENAAGVYRSEYKNAGDAILLTRELIVKKDVFTPQEYPALRELIKKTVEDYNAAISYRADRTFLREKSATMRKKPKTAGTTSDRLFEAALESMIPTRITARQAVALEAKLKTAPDDLQARKSLVHYYSERDTPVKEKAFLRHSLWFVQKQPQLFSERVFGVLTLFFFSDNETYRTIRTELLKQVEANNADGRIRANAIDFIKHLEWREAEKLLLEGRKLEPENFDYSYTLADLYGKQADEAQGKSAEDRLKYLTLAFNEGEQTLVLLKRERSDERDKKRAALLVKIAEAAFELNKLDKAKLYATELVLEFGDNPNRTEFADSTHYGNIALGKIALRENALEKAKEHLLIAARAPQRSSFNIVSPDFKFAALLLERGEKDVVLEYLTLCEKFEFADKEALKKWREEIKAGKIPKFETEEFE